MSAGRPSIVGSDDGPEAPFPLTMEGNVISGFGRGSKELGIPTANLPVDEARTPWIKDATSGVYFGYASLSSPDSSSSSSPPGFKVYPMVMSIGYNPFYRNTVRSAEVHVLHDFAGDFYGARMRLLLLGFVRPELDYTTLEALVADIRFDCEVARGSLAREAWAPRRGVVEGAEGVDGRLDVGWLVRPLGEEDKEEEKEKSA